jgi:hypothetical protein
LSNISQITESLATSVQTLVEKHKELMIELKEIRSYNNLLKNQITDKDNKITELNEKLKNQTTNSAGNGETENKEALKLLVKETVAEVDKCLELLNNN